MADDKLAMIEVDEEHGKIVLSAKMAAIMDYRKDLMNQSTPKDQVCYKPGGTNIKFPYVSNAYMDNVFKEHYPLYEVSVIDIQIDWKALWVSFVVCLKEKLTGNQEVGAGAARIQLKRTDKEAGNLDPSSIVDFDKNIKSALTNAIKNAQSKFGVCADIYEKNIIPAEVIEEWRVEYMSLVEKYIVQPMLKQKAIDKWALYKNKRELLEDLREELNIEN